MPRDDLLDEIMGEINKQPRVKNPVAATRGDDGLIDEIMSDIGGGKKAQASNDGPVRVATPYAQDYPAHEAVLAVRQASQRRPTVAEKNKSLRETLPDELRDADLETGGTFTQRFFAGIARTPEGAYNILSSRYGKDNVRITNGTVFVKSPESGKFTILDPLSTDFKDFTADIGADAVQNILSIASGIATANPFAAAATGAGLETARQMASKAAGSKEPISPVSIGIEGALSGGGQAVGNVVDYAARRALPSSYMTEAIRESVKSTAKAGGATAIPFSVDPPKKGLAALLGKTKELAADISRDPINILMGKSSYGKSIAESPEVQRRIELLKGTNLRPSMSQMTGDPTAEAYELTLKNTPEAIAIAKRNRAANDAELARLAQELPRELGYDPSIGDISLGKEALESVGDKDFLRNSIESSLDEVKSAVESIAPKEKVADLYRKVKIDSNNYLKSLEEEFKATGKRFADVDSAGSPLLFDASGLKRIFTEIEEKNKSLGLSSAALRSRSEFRRRAAEIDRLENGLMTWKDLNNHISDTSKHLKRTTTYIPGMPVDEQTKIAKNVYKELMSMLDNTIAEYESKGYDLGVIKEVRSKYASLGEELRGFNDTIIGKIAGAETPEESFKIVAKKSDPSQIESYIQAIKRVSPESEKKVVRGVVDSILENTRKKGTTTDEMIMDDVSFIESLAKGSAGDKLKAVLSGNKEVHQNIMKQYGLIRTLQKRQEQNKLIPMMQSGEEQVVNWLFTQDNNQLVRDSFRSIMQKNPKLAERLQGRYVQHILDKSNIAGTPDSGSAAKIAGSIFDGYSNAKLRAVMLDDKRKLEKVIRLGRQAEIFKPSQKENSITGLINNSTDLLEIVSTVSGKLSTGDLRGAAEQAIRNALSIFGKKRSAELLYNTEDAVRVIYGLDAPTGSKAFISAALKYPISKYIDFDEEEIAARKRKETVKTIKDIQTGTGE